MILIAFVVIVGLIAGASIWFSDQQDKGGKR